MKLTIVIILVSMMHVSATVYSQATKITLDMHGTTIIRVLEQIELLSDFRFIYQNEQVDLDKRIDIQIKDMQVEEILDEIFEGEEIEYSITESNLILIKGVAKKRYAEIADSEIVQQKTVSGKITDKGGEPLPGVTVVIKGKTIGTVTDLNGSYSVSGISNNTILVFSFVGMRKQEIVVGPQTQINVVMEDETIGIEEVIAIGYGKIKKSVVTGAISSVQMEKEQPGGTQRVDQMLQGRAAGVMVLNTDGAPGGNTTVRIRGMNSIQGGNDALVVIDGFQGGDLNSLNPNDIASIEILKDASATAIYGSKGANGVILVETKIGKTDRPVVNYSSEVGISNIIMGGIELMDAADYAREINLFEMSKNHNNTPIPIFTDDEIAEFERTGGTDWVDEVYQTGITQNHQLSLSGKTKNVNYFLSGAYFNQEGILINSGYKRYSIRANVSADINKWLSCGINFNGVQQDKEGIRLGSAVDHYANPVNAAMIYAPTLPVYNEDGSYSTAVVDYGSQVWNPVASVKEPEVKKYITQNFANLFLEFKVLEGLTFRMQGGAKLYNETSTEFYNTKTYTGKIRGGLGKAINRTQRYLQNSNILNYTKDIGKHHINATAVGEIQYTKQYYLETENRDFVVQETGVYNLGGAKIQESGSYFFERKINSALTRINYAYGNKYVCAFSYRADGASVFGANNKWAYFPSASIGWRLTEENLLKENGVVSNLMIRGSWGKTGNQAIDPYKTLAKVSSPGFYPWDGGENLNLGFEISSASNPDLKWETTTQKNIGLDFSLYNNKLRFTAEYYDKVTDDLLMPREIPRSTGLNSVIDNVGSMGNKGWEFTLDADINIKKLKWTTGMSFSAAKTTVLDLGDDDYISYSAGGSGQGADIPFMYLTAGERFGQIMGFGYEGTWNLGEEEEAGKYGQMPGEPRYTDVNDDGMINYDGDWKVIGNVLPDFIFGITNRFNYKKWDLSLLVQGVYGNDIFNVARIQREDDRFGTSTDRLKRWTDDNQNTDIPALIDEQSRIDYQNQWNEAHPDQSFVSTVVFPANGGNVNSRWIEDGSYIRLKNVSLGYTFPKSKYFNSLRLYANATNLFTLTKYSGFAPEVSSYTDNDATMGTDYNSYPQSRIITIGLNVTF